MRFPDEVRKCSAFLQCQLASGRQKLCGSAFFVRIDDTDEGRATKFDVVSFLYLVTARHVVDGIWDTLKKQVQIRGAKKGRSPISAWAVLSSWPVLSEREDSR
jgi:hypothetical protein